MNNETTFKLLLTKDLDLTRIFKKNMDILGYQAITTSEISAAEDFLEKQDADIIILDINYYTGSGEEHRLLSKFSDFDLPLIVIYYPDDTGNLSRMEDVPACGYIALSSDIEVWKASMKAALCLSSAVKKSGTVKIKNELERMRSMLSDVLNTIPIRVFWKDLDSVYMGCNRLFAVDSGKTGPEDIIGLTDYDIRDEERAALNRLDDRRVISSGKPRINYEEPFLTIGGIKNWISTSKIPLYNQDGQMYGVLGMYENITERKQMEEQLKLQKNRLANIIYGSNAGTWEWNIQTGENVVNDYWASIIGYSLNELPLDKPVFFRDFIHPEDLPDVDRKLDAYYKNESDFYECEFRMRHKNGSWVWIVARGKTAVWSEDHKPLLISGVHIDITKRKNAQAELLQQLEEKEIILKEVHHRIKNNFASISSLLTLQADSFSNEETREALVDAAGRVRSLQLLYEKLLLIDNYSSTTANGYLEDLIEDIINVYEDEVRIHIETDLCECRLNTRQLFPVGIIINELITNAIKYAFPERNSGTIRIALRKDDDQYTLVIHDDGSGLPEGIDENSEHGFGLMLVKAFCQQLKGSLKIENASGTRVTVQFKAQD